LNGEGIATPDDRGRRVLDDSFYLIFNAHHEPGQFRLPRARWGKHWTLVLDTEHGFTSANAAVRLGAGETFALSPRSLAVWQR